MFNAATFVLGHTLTTQKFISVLSIITQMLFIGNLCVITDNSWITSSRSPSDKQLHSIQQQFYHRLSESTTSCQLCFIQKH